MSAGGGLIMAGGISMVASDPLLIGAVVNANRAAELSHHTQPIDLPKHANGGPKSFPSLKISIPL